MNQSLHRQKRAVERVVNRRERGRHASLPAGELEIPRKGGGAEV